MRERHTAAAAHRNSALGHPLSRHCAEARRPPATTTATTTTTTAAHTNIASPFIITFTVTVHRNGALGHPLSPHRAEMLRPPSTTTTTTTTTAAYAASPFSIAFTLSGVGALWDCAPRVYGGGGGCRVNPILDPLTPTCNAPLAPTAIAHSTPVAGPPSGMPGPVTPTCIAPFTPTGIAHSMAFVGPPSGIIPCLARVWVYNHRPRRTRSDRLKKRKEKNINRSLLTPMLAL